MTTKDGTAQLHVARCAVVRALKLSVGIMDESEFGYMVRALRALDELLGNGESTTCFVCALTSYNRNDIVQKYCDNCHKFYDEMGFLPV